MKLNQNKILYFFIITFLVLLWPSSSAAKDKKDVLLLSLSQAIDMARERHIKVMVANERVNQALARIGQSRSSLLPQLTGEVSQERQTRNLQTMGIASPEPLVGPFNSFDARIHLTQTLFDLAAIKRLKAAQDARQLSLAEQRKTEQDVLALVAAFFLEAKRARETQKAAKALFDYQKEKFKIAHLKFKNGIGSSLEVKQSAAIREKSFFDWRSAVAQAVQRRLDLAAALGLPADQPIQFVEIEEERLPNTTLPTEEEILESLLKQPNLEAARQKVQMTKSELAGEKAMYLPKISGLANYGASGENLGDSDDTYLIGLQASVPIFEGGLRQARIEEASSQMKESEATLKDTEYQTEAKIFNAMEEVKKARVFLKQKKAEAQVARQNFTLAQDRLNSGIGSPLEFSEHSAQNVISEDGLKEAEATYLLSQINLAHALGKLDQLFNRETLHKGEKSER